MSKTTNDTSLDEAVARINRNYGEGAIMRLGDRPAEVRVIPTGSLGLDLALGVGGYPLGRVVEIYGPEMSGKTTLSLLAIANVQKSGGVAAFVDAEHSINPEYARMLGVDIDNLLISQPSNGEEALEIVEALVRSNGVRLIVVDSVAALVPKSELDGEMGDSHVGQHARLMSQAMRKLTGAMHRSSTTVIFINQLRDKIGVMFGNPEVTTGGKALKFYASVRLDVRRAESIKDANGVIGNTVKVKVVKNKVAPPFKDTIFPIIYSQGLDQLGEILTLGERYAVLEKRGGGWYYFGEERLGRGSEGAKEFLRSNPEMLTQITDGIKSRAQNTSAGILTNTSPKIALQAPSD